MRRTFRSRFSELTRKIVSTFAASTCSSVALRFTLREILVRRGRTAWIVARPSGRGCMATQSPTAGSSPRPAAS